jgi:Holliday junction resolvase
MSSDYNYGRRKELQVGEFLVRRGFKVERFRGSRGPVDLIAKKGGLQLAIQVKATRDDIISAERLKRTDETRLIRSAAGRKAKPVLALVSRNYFELFSVPNAEPIAKGELKPLRRDYREHT